MCAPLFCKLPQLKSSCIKGSCLLSRFISVIFSSLFSFSPLSLHTFFFRLLIPLCFFLFVSYPVCFSPLPLFALPTCQGDSPPKRSDVFCFIFISHFWRVHFFFFSFLSFFFFFLKCCLKGSISQVLLCPPT